jgi:hypothetical protein
MPELARAKRRLADARHLGDERLTAQPDEIPARIRRYLGAQDRRICRVTVHDGRRYRRPPVRAQRKTRVSAKSAIRFA